MELRKILSLFGIDSSLEISEMKSGHINRTYLVGCSSGEQYVLQSLNKEVFCCPEIVMENISAVEKAFEQNKPMRVRVPHYLKAGSENYAEADGEVWRVYEYAPPLIKASAFNNVNYLTGLSFGTFMRTVSSKTVMLRPAIDRFHDFGRYFSMLTALDSGSRLKKIDAAIMARLSSIKETLSQVFTETFPKRNVHSDAKPDNVVIGECCTVIDLDTAMKGYAALDYGDMIRSVCKGTEPDMSAILDVTRGFADGLEGILSSDEIDSLYYGILWVTGELAMRYLIDCISEKRYFKGKTPAECLNRANVLLSQLNRFIIYGNDITEVIYRVFGGK